jgi:S1-C subfamily serine protease
VTVGHLAEAEGARAAAAPAQTGSLGLAVEPLPPDRARALGLGSGGVLVRDVEDGSPAAAAGIQRGDVIAEVDRRPIAGVEDLRRAVARHAKGSPALMLVHRDGGALYVAVVA